MSKPAATDAADTGTATLVPIGLPEMTSPALDEPEKAGPEDLYFARFGTFMLAAPCKTPESGVIRDSIEEALRRDSRVSVVEDVPFREHWVGRWTAYPSTHNMDTLLSGADHFHAIKFKDPFVFAVTVPIKNQPLFRGEDDVPTDTYYVSWNGITAFVLWKREAGRAMPPRSGGHVVINILSDAVASAGLSLYQQPCSPGCTNVFAHRVMRIERFATEPDVVRGIKAWGFPSVDVHVHTVGGELDVAQALITILGELSDAFARSKNDARRLLDLEMASRSHVDSLLEIQHAQIMRRRLSLAKRAKESWNHRADSKRSRELVADLWLALARIETIKRDWDSDHHLFQGRVQTRKAKDLFDTDMGDDEHLLESLDVSFIRAAIEQTATRHDARIVALATLAGGAAGLAGAAVGGVLS